MWNRKELKHKGKTSFKKNYWNSVIVSIIIIAFAGSRGLSRLAEMKIGDESLTVNSSGVMGDLVNAFSNGDTAIMGDIARASHASQGIFATVLNESANSGSFVYGLVNGFNHLLFKGDIGSGIIILLCGIIMFLFWFLFQNIILVGQHRFFLESRIYRETKVSRIFFVYTTKKVKNVAFVMFLRTMFLFLWGLTIVGVFIKIYSYRMVPYILAENPDIHWKDAFRLSRQMMDGNKMRAFVLDLSFIGWNILSVVSFSLVSIFWLHPYKESTDVELYKELRGETLLCDSSLAKYFADPLVFENSDNQLSEYPQELCPFEEDSSKKWLTVNPQKKYSLVDLVLLFFAISLIGYVYEVLYYIVDAGEIVNRGTMYGPWLPIYGCGGILSLLLLKRFVKHPVATFFMAMLLCGVVEYSTAWYLETFHHVKWWDYTGFFLNLQGRVCLEQLITFGLGCCLNIYMLAPLLTNWMDKIPKRVRIVTCVVLLALFLMDATYSHFHPNMDGGVPMS